MPDVCERWDEFANKLIKNDCSTGLRLAVSGTARYTDSLRLKLESRPMALVLHPGMTFARPAIVPADR